MCLPFNPAFKMSYRSKGIVCLNSVVSSGVLNSVGAEGT
jgi:hypothetical protein